MDAQSTTRRSGCSQIRERADTEVVDHVDGVFLGEEPVDQV